MVQHGSALLALGARPDLLLIVVELCILLSICTPLRALKDNVACLPSVNVMR